jgi:ABC-type transport system substrate-binding protein/DNA-binding SARP family transcriptional activator
LEATVDGQPIALGGRRQRAVLAVLLLHANELVVADRLVEEAWSGRPPAGAIGTLQTYISRLRRVLEGTGAVITTRGDAYQLVVDPEELDVLSFQRLVEEGQRALRGGEAARARGLFTEALGLWRGEPMADLAYDGFAADAIRDLGETWLAARSGRVEADLMMGHGDAALVADIRGLIERSPFDERLREQLMLALYRSGRQAEALAAYQEARRMLVGDYGIEPTARLRDLERAILLHDPALDLAAPIDRTNAPRERNDGLVAGSDASGGTGAEPRRSRRGSRMTLILVGAGAVIAALVAVGAILGRGGSRSPLRLPANAVVSLDPRSGRVQTETSLRDPPSAMTVGAGAVWVAEASAAQVERIDAATGTATPIAVGHDPSAIVAGLGAVWVADTGDGTVSRINPTDYFRRVATIPVGDGPSGIAVVRGALWVTDRLDDTLVKVDPTRDRFSKRITLAAPPTCVAGTADAVWVCEPSIGIVEEVNATTAEQVESVPVSGGPTAVSAIGGRVWVTAADGTTSVIDPTHDDRVVTGVVGGGPASIAGADGSVWVGDPGHARLTSVVASRGGLVRTHFLATGTPTAALTAGKGGLWAATLASPATHRGGTVRVVSFSLGEVRPDPAFSIDQEQEAMFFATNDGLIGLRKVSGSGGYDLVPDLAESLPRVADGDRSYTFTLRRRIRYSTGARLRAQDVRATFERAFRSELGSPALAGRYLPASLFFSDIRGASSCTPARCDLREGIVTDNRARTVTFRLTAPDPDFVAKLAIPVAYILPAGTPVDHSGDAVLPATGPYEIRAVNVRARGANEGSGTITLVRNAHFHVWSSAAQPAGYPDRIVFRGVLATEMETEMVEHGQADWMTDAIPADRLRQVIDDYPALLHPQATAETSYMLIDTKSAPLSDVRVRQALSDAVDRQRLLRMEGGPLTGVVTCQLLPPSFPGYSRYCPYTTGAALTREWTAPNLARARRLVAASDTRRQRVMTIGVRGPHSVEGIPASYFGRLLSGLGYDPLVRQLPRQAFGGVAYAPQRPPQLFLAAWLADYVGANDFLANFTCSQNPFYCNRHYDALVAHALAVQNSSPSRADLLWQKADRYLTDQAALIPLWNLIDPGFVSKRVGDYQSNPVLGAPLIDQLWVR